MGLDTTHDCWHSPYSQFTRWREWISLFVMMDRGETDSEAQAIANMGATREAYIKALEDGHYDDPGVPINVLLGHSDCDGEIRHADCLPLATALEALLVRMPERGLYDEKRPATLRFVAGLRRAHEAGEDVKFG